MSIFKKLSIVLYRVYTGNQCTLYTLYSTIDSFLNIDSDWYMYNVYVHTNKLSLRAAVVANRSITASMHRWICSIIRHLRRFSSIEAPIAVLFAIIIFI